MTREEKKKYQRERKAWKEANTKYIKDDSDNEQLTSSGDEDLVLSASEAEDEKEREERLAKEALKSYAQSFSVQEAPPEDYQLVMRKDVWDKELDEEVAQPGFETLEDIEIRDKQERIEQRNKTKQEKARAERLRRMQAFQASSAVRMEEEEQEESEPEPEEDEDKEEVEEAQGNSFYSSYNEAMQGEEKDNVEDPLKEERLRRQKELAEDEAALAAMGSEDQDAAKRRKMAEFKLWKSQRKQSDPNKASKDMVDAQQELDKAAFDERWKNDEKMKEVFTSSKLVSKAKMKMKLAAGGGGASSSTQQETKKEESEKKANTEKKDEESKEESNVDALPDMIGSMNQYAKILGKSVTELNEEKFQPPPAEASDSEDEEGSDKEGDLWGAIMGT
eukprot:TRINITY_DN1220_c0_g1_i1.p1 TRINITY_DN1220_c0_g1~~TRINITY_DN1220_c0_g1_i1.p1  ORF type:complete len:400 (-),score=185.90 TRINITY_DN1220_c0_g1_i1:188-1360(-)